jgi:elongation factor Tu
MERMKAHDIKGKLKYIGKRMPIYSGIRPVALIKKDYLTTIHIDFDHIDVLSDREEIDVSASFISPEAYPHTLWLGKTIILQDGSKLWGYLTVTEILNHLLEINEDNRV